MGLLSRLIPDNRFRILKLTANRTVTNRFSKTLQQKSFFADFEGLVLRYTPAGSVDWSQDYGQGLIAGLRNGWN